MSTDVTTPHASAVADSERGLLVFVLALVVLGVTGMFLMSA